MKLSVQETSGTEFFDLNGNQLHYHADLDPSGPSQGWCGEFPILERTVHPCFVRLGRLSYAPDLVVPMERLNGLVIDDFIWLPPSLWTFYGSLVIRHKIFTVTEVLLFLLPSYGDLGTLIVTKTNVMHCSLMKPVMCIVMSMLCTYV